MLLSNAAENLIGQPMFKTLDEVQKLERDGKNILHFELGEPNFDTPKNITEAAIRSLRSGDTHYVNSYGLYEFRTLIQETTLISRNFKPEIDQILITPGANAIIYYVISCILNPGDEVIIPNPGFPTYRSAASFAGANIVDLPLYESNGFEVNVEDLKKIITSKTKLLILNSPSNPLGSVTSISVLKEIFKVADHYNFYILSDEIYSRMIYGKSDDYNFFSIGSIDKCNDRTIILNGFSKAFAMTGWRVGAAIGPKNIINKMMLLLQTINSCVPAFIQKAAMEAINGDKTDVDKMMHLYKTNRDYLVEGLNSVKGISCSNPAGAIYAFPNIKQTNMSSYEFSSLLLNKMNIATLPGSDFGNYGEGYVRFSFTNDFNSIKLAIKRIRDYFGDKV